MDGLLILDKPQGLTSMQALARVKRLLRIKKAGHTGTLDPIATGVLPICLGQATRLAQYLLASEKRYEAEMRLGIETDTLDSEGTILQETPVPSDLSNEQIIEALARYVGPQMQQPPAFSALKIQGQRAYDLARAGKEVELEARPVEIFSIELLSIELPFVRFSCHVSKGTYIRSLIRDLGQELGCGAHMSALRRTQAGSFAIDQTLTLEQIEADPEAAKATVLTLEQMLEELPAVQLDEEEARRLRQGLIAHTLQTRAPETASEAEDIHRALDPQQRVVALLQPSPQGWSIARVLAQP
ncbi:MAG: tRNA pseudouridine(55) synthase TruB [Myxococcales bacterium]|nr:tRNA pseudouridine(55) synthase TruB [Myxococcales bacterium]MCB9643089.1 tRNA pseudouridine(55) synthase TruB [Myxococcales bacterium]